ncbi:MAG: peptidoglycan editing factor PgeF [Thermosulfidibacteraceae bacterium]|jgi:YfiH family protein
MIKIGYKNIKAIFTDNRINLSYKHIPYERAIKNWSKFKKEYLGEEIKLSYLTQIHSEKVKFVENPGWQGWGDGLITTKELLALTIFVADCTPLIIFDEKGTIVANLHCGWKSVKYRIIENAIERIRMYTREKLLALIGPSARECCYEVDNEFIEHFKNYLKAFKIRQEKIYFSLIEVIEEILETLGVEIIYKSEICTICTKNFFSYRRTKGKERQISIVYKSI